MKYLKTFENYLDDILDKINISGYKSLSKLEKDYLNASSTDDKIKQDSIEKEAGVKSFTSSDKYFTFDFSHMEDFGDEQIYYGTIYCPSIEFENGKTIEGIIEGSIEVRDEVVQPNFEKEAFGSTYGIYEFCNGLEYELDNFMQYIIEELNS